jgi:hypothetical protein
MQQIIRSTVASLLVAGVVFVSACTKEEPVGPSTSAVVQSASDCDKVPDPKSSDESAAGRAAAATQGASARAACKRDISAFDKGNADLRRIREIQEKQQAERDSRKVSEEQWRHDMKRGASAPLKQYSY